MGYTSETLYSPQQVSGITGLCTATLANWRSRREGPTWLKTGRKIWYPVADFESWMEGLKVGTENSAREMALSVSSGRPKILRKHRFGRHRTKQDESGEEGSRRASNGDRRQGRPAQA